MGVTSFDLLSAEIARWIETPEGQHWLVLNDCECELESTLGQRAAHAGYTMQEAMASLLERSRDEHEFVTRQVKTIHTQESMRQSADLLKNKTQGKE
jgi:hypothetical protein